MSSLSGRKGDSTAKSRFDASRALVLAPDSRMTSAGHRELVRRWSEVIANVHTRDRVQVAMALFGLSVLWHVVSTSLGQLPCGEIGQRLPAVSVETNHVQFVWNYSACAPAGDRYLYVMS